MEQSTDSSVGPSRVVLSGQKWDRVNSLSKGNNLLAVTSAEHLTDIQLRVVTSN